MQTSKSQDSDGAMLKIQHKGRQREKNDDN